MIATLSVTKRVCVCMRLCVIVLIFLTVIAMLNCCCRILLFYIIAPHFVYNFLCCLLLTFCFVYSMGVVRQRERKSEEESERVRERERESVRELLKVNYLYLYC